MYVFDGTSHIMHVSILILSCWSHMQNALLHGVCMFTKINDTVQFYDGNPVPA